MPKHTLPPRYESIKVHCQGLDLGYKSQSTHPALPTATAASIKITGSDVSAAVATAQLRKKTQGSTVVVIRSQ